MASYAAATVLQGIILELLRLHVPSVVDVRIARLPGPFRPCNWTIEWMDVLAEDYGRARDKADELQAKGHLIMVPDGHKLDGQVHGKEFGWSDN